MSLTVSSSSCFSRDVFFFFALQLTDRVLAPNLAFSEGTMVLWQEKKRKERKREREIRGGKLMGSVEVREEERRGGEG